MQIGVIVERGKALISPEWGGLVLQSNGFAPGKHGHYSGSLLPGKETVKELLT